MSPSEFDLSYARKASVYSTQFLVQQLVDLLTVACMATSSTYDCLRIKGAYAMLSVVVCFQEVVDPDGEGELLLQLYSAQVTSALTASMKNKSDTIGSAPQLRAAACELCVVYLLSGLTDDEVVVARTLKMLLTPLQRPADVQLWYAQYDGNMATMVLLSHLSALCQLQLAIRHTPLTVGGKRKRKQPKQLALQCIAAALQPHFPWLQRQYLLALRDYALVLVTQKKDLQRSKGAFFDGATATRVMDVFAPVWAVFLSATAEVGVEEEGVDSEEDGGDQSGRDVALLVSLILSTLHTIFAYEVIAVQRRRAVDTSVSEAEKEREQRQTLLCLQALPSLLTPSMLTSPAQTTSAYDLIAELLPLLQWALQHRLTAEPAIVQPRQAASASVLSSLLQSLLEVFQSPSLPSLPASSSSLAELLQGLSETLATAVYQHLPLASPHSPDQVQSPSSASSPPPSSTHFSFPPSSSSQQARGRGGCWATAEVYVGEETARFLTALLQAVPQLSSLWLVGAQAQRRWQQMEERRDKGQGGEGAEEDGAALSSPLATPFPTPPSVHLVGLVALCRHVLTQGSPSLVDVAVVSLRGLVESSVRSSAHRQWPGLFHPPALELLADVEAFVQGSEVSDLSFRVAALLKAAWILSSAPRPAQSSMDDLMSAQASSPPIDVDLLRALAGLLTVCLSSSAHRTAALQLLTHAVFPVDAADAAALPLLQSSQSASRDFLCPLIAPALLSLLKDTTDPTVSLLAAQAVQAAAVALPDRSTALLPLLLPCLIHSLAVSPSSLSCITQLATTFPPTFKAIVASLPVQLKVQLQTAAMAHTSSLPSHHNGVDDGGAGAEAAEANGGSAVDGGGEGRSGGRDKKGRKKKRADAESGHHADAISLSTDFSSFARKK